MTHCLHPDQAYTLFTSQELEVDPPSDSGQELAGGRHARELSVLDSFQRALSREEIPDFNGTLNILRHSSIVTRPSVLGLRYDVPAFVDFDQHDLGFAGIVPDGSVNKGRIG
jgi:hypothetical protein